MKKIFALVLALCMMTVCAGASATTFDALQDMLRNSSNAADPTQAPEATEVPAQDGFFVTDCQDGLSVKRYNVFTMDSTNYVYVYLFLELTNSGDRTVEVDGAIEVLDKNSAVAEEQSYLFAYPSVIAPGEVAYVEDFVMVKKDNTIGTGSDVGQVKLSLFRDAYNREPTLPTYTQSAVEVGSGVNKYGNEVDNMYRVAVINSTGADLYNPYVVVAMYDAGGQLLYVTKDQVSCGSQMAIPNGNGFVTTGYVDSDISEYFAQEGLSVANAVSIVYSE